MWTGLEFVERTVLYIEEVSSRSGTMMTERGAGLSSLQTRPFHEASAELEGIIASSLPAMP